MLEDLAWLGFEADGPVVRQSDRDDIYRPCARGAPCSVASCTPAAVRASEVARAFQPRDPDAHETAALQTDEPCYPGTCRDRGLVEGPGVGLRVRLEPSVERFVDLRLGPQEQRPSEQCGDLLVRDRDGNWTYQFAAAVDDYVQGVTLVIRGTDLLSSTGRQIQLARLLGRAEPAGVPASRVDHENAAAEAEQVGRRHRDPRASGTRLDAGSGDRARDGPGARLSRAIVTGPTHDFPYHGRVMTATTLRGLVAAAAIGVTVAAVAPSSGSAPAFVSANDAWERGDYVAALNGFLRVLNRPDGDAWLEPIALTTGELFETRELTADGRAPRFSPDDELLAYETGLETSRGTLHPAQRRVAGAGRGSARRLGDVFLHARPGRVSPHPRHRRDPPRVGGARAGVADGAESRAAGADADVAHRAARRRSSSAIWATAARWSCRRRICSRPA